MNKNYFIELAGYNIWADTVAMGWLNQLNDEQWYKIIASSFSSIQQTTVHIVSAEKIWLDFWKNRPNPSYLSTEFKGLKYDLLDIWKEVCIEMRNFFERFPEDNYTQQVTFRYPRGGEGQIAFWQAFAHIMNHSTYHRGQLVTLLRQVGFTDFSSIDLATYYRLHQK